MRKKSQHIRGFKEWYEKNISVPMQQQGSDWHILTETRRLTNHYERLSKLVGEFVQTFLS
jgi:hypothetical protein